MNKIAIISISLLVLAGGELWKHRLILEDNFDVGIISYNINTPVSNYGAALHSYAMQKYLDKLA